MVVTVCDGTSKLETLSTNDSGTSLPSPEKFSLPSPFILALQVYSRGNQMLFLLLLLVTPAASLDCATAPTAALQIICRQLQNWDNGARQTPATKDVKAPGIAGAAGMAAEFAPIASNMYQCMDIQCLCVFFRGTGGNNCVVQGVPMGKALRKEYRQLSDDERNRFHGAMKTLKSNGEYDRLARVHAQFANSGGAHSGPAFLPWHREYMKRIEIALRQVDPSLALPYWDSTLDQNLPDSKDSMMWTNELMGESTGGQISGGAFADFRTLEGRPKVRRAIGAQAKLFSENEITYLMNVQNINQMLAFTAPRPACPFQPEFNVLEYTHGNVHLYVGGEMFETATAANDPVFFMHHSFVDLLWEMWRLNRQSRGARETDYPADNNQCGSEHHFRSAFMRPFPPMRNTDGLSNMYTDNLYTYAPRPSCNQGPHCGSKYLFCDRSHGAPRCASKIRNGGNCTGYVAGESMCANNGACVSGKCSSAGTVPPATPPPTIKPPVVKFEESCFNEHECCSYWSSIGECPKNYIYMSQWCKASCDQCRPNYDLRNECLDRHANCASWSAKGECRKNPLWMNENCRRSCNRCAVSRTSVCSLGGGGDQTTRAPATPPPIQQPPNQGNGGCNSPMCYNEDSCCPFWASQGGCRNNPGYMTCQCRVSCGQCSPTYNYGTCTDYHNDCQKWSRSGECQKNKWMIENCRRSCNSCANRQNLAMRCGRRVSRTAFLKAIDAM